MLSLSFSQAFLMHVSCDYVKLSVNIIHKQVAKL